MGNLSSGPRAHPPPHGRKSRRRTRILGAARRVRHPVRPMRSRLAVSPKLYARITLVALVALALIVVTGAAVRLTGSGLGCPDWPKCYGKVVAPLEFHAVVEYGNRLITGLVGIVVIAAPALACFRKPFRWHLALFGAFLPV